MTAPPVPPGSDRDRDAALLASLPAGAGYRYDQDGRVSPSGTLTLAELARANPDAEAVRLDLEAAELQLATHEDFGAVLHGCDWMVELERRLFGPPPVDVVAQVRRALARVGRDDLAFGLADHVIAREARLQLLALERLWVACEQELRDLEPIRLDGTAGEPQLELRHDSSADEWAAAVVRQARAGLAFLLGACS